MWRGEKWAGTYMHYVFCQNDHLSVDVVVRNGGGVKKSEKVKGKRSDLIRFLRHPVFLLFVKKRISFPSFFKIFHVVSFSLFFSQFPSACLSYLRTDDHKKSWVEDSWKKLSIRPKNRWVVNAPWTGREEERIQSWFTRLFSPFWLKRRRYRLVSSHPFCYKPIF